MSAIGRALRSDEVLETCARAPLADVAIDAPGGPHVTPVLHAPAGGELWFLLGRRSLKARVLRRRPGAGVLLRAGERALVMSGELRAVELRAPLGTRQARRLALAPLAGFSYSARNAGVWGASGRRTPACSPKITSKCPGPGKE